MVHAVERDSALNGSVAHASLNTMEEAELCTLRLEARRLHKRLPIAVKRLTDGYKKRCYWFEIFECLSKLFTIGFPVAIAPGSSLQRFVGLQVCFITWGAHTHFSPFDFRGDNLLAGIVQLNLFTTLLAAFVLDEDPESEGVDVMLMTMLLLPFALALVSELGLFQRACGRRQRQPSDASGSKAPTDAKADLGSSCEGSGMHEEQEAASAEAVRTCKEPGEAAAGGSTCSRHACRGQRAFGQPRELNSRMGAAGAFAATLFVNRCADKGNEMRMPGSDEQALSSDATQQSAPDHMRGEQATRGKSRMLQPRSPMPNASQKSQSASTPRGRGRLSLVAGVSLKVRNSLAKPATPSGQQTSNASCGHQQPERRSGRKNSCFASDLWEAAVKEKAPSQRRRASRRKQAELTAGERRGANASSAGQDTTQVVMQAMHRQSTLEAFGLASNVDGAGISRSSVLVPPARLPRPVPPPPADSSRPFQPKYQS